MTHAGGHGSSVPDKTQGTSKLVSRNRGAWHGPPRLGFKYQGHAQARGPSRGRGLVGGYPDAPAAMASAARPARRRRAPGCGRRSTRTLLQTPSSAPSRDGSFHLRGTAEPSSPRPRSLAPSVAIATAPLAEQGIWPISEASTRRVLSFGRSCRRRGSWGVGSSHALRPRRARRGLDGASIEAGETRSRIYSPRRRVVDPHGSATKAVDGRQGSGRQPARGFRGAHEWPRVPVGKKSSLGSRTVLPTRGRTPLKSFSDDAHNLSSHQRRRNSVPHRRTSGDSHHRSDLGYWSGGATGQGPGRSRGACRAGPADHGQGCQPRRAAKRSRHWPPPPGGRRVPLDRHEPGSAGTHLVTRSASTPGDATSPATTLADEITASSAPFSDGQKAFSRIPSKGHSQRDRWAPWFW